MQDNHPTDTPQSVAPISDEDFESVCQYLIALGREPNHPPALSAADRGDGKP